MRRQVFPFHIVHCDIGRAVRFKEVMDADDVGMLKARQNSSFVQEAFQAPLEIRRCLWCLWHDGQVLFAGSQVRG